MSGSAGPPDIPPAGAQRVRIGIAIGRLREGNLRPGQRLPGGLLFLPRDGLRRTGVSGFELRAQTRQPGLARRIGCFHRAPLRPPLTGHYLNDEPDADGKEDRQQHADNAVALHQQPELAERANLLDRGGEPAEIGLDVRLQF